MSYPSGSSSSTSSSSSSLSSKPPANTPKREFRNHQWVSGNPNVTAGVGTSLTKHGINIVTSALVAVQQRATPFAAATNRATAQITVLGNQKPSNTNESAKTLASRTIPLGEKLVCTGSNGTIVTLQGKMLHFYSPVSSAELQKTDNALNFANYDKIYIAQSMTHKLPFDNPANLTDFHFDDTNKTITFLDKTTDTVHRSSLGFDSCLSSVWNLADNAQHLPTKLQSNERYKIEKLVTTHSKENQTHYAVISHQKQVTKQATAEVTSPNVAGTVVWESSSQHIIDVSNNQLIASDLSASLHCWKHHQGKLWTVDEATGVLCHIDISRKSNQVKQQTDVKEIAFCEGVGASLTFFSSNNANFAIVALKALSDDHPFRRSITPANQASPFHEGIAIIDLQRKASIERIDLRGAVDIQIIKAHCATMVPQYDPAGKDAYYNQVKRAADKVSQNAIKQTTGAQKDNKSQNKGKGKNNSDNSSQSNHFEALADTNSSLSGNQSTTFNKSSSQGGSKPPTQQQPSNNNNPGGGGGTNP